MNGILKIFEEDEEFFSKAINLKKLFLKACKHGKTKLVKHLIREYSKNVEFDYYDGFMEAYYKERKKVMKWMYKNGYYRDLSIPIKKSFRDGKKLEIIKFLVSLNPDIITVLIPMHKELFKTCTTLDKMIWLYDNVKPFVYSDDLFTFCYEGEKDIVEWIYPKLTLCTDYMINKCFFESCRSGDIELAKYIHSQATPEMDIEYETYMHAFEVMSTFNLEMTKWLLEIYPAIDTKRHDYKVFKHADSDVKEWLYIISDEKEKLYNMCFNTTKEKLLKLHDAANVIKKAWLSCYYSPYTKIGIKRLNKEYDELVEDGIISEK